MTPEISKAKTSILGLFLMFDVGRLFEMVVFTLISHDSRAMVFVQGRREAIPSSLWTFFLGFCLWGREMRRNNIEREKGNKRKPQ